MTNSSIDNSSLLSDRAKDDHPVGYRKHIRSIILIPDDKSEYDRIKDLDDIVRYQSKLMACYGFDVEELSITILMDNSTHSLLSSI